MRKFSFWGCRRGGGAPFAPKPGLGRSEAMQRRVGCPSRGLPDACDRGKMMELPDGLVLGLAAFRAAPSLMIVDELPEPTGRSNKLEMAQRYG